jgi:hypothetical protein
MAAERAADEGFYETADALRAIALSLQSSANAANAANAAKSGISISQYTH